MLFDHQMQALAPLRRLVQGKLYVHVSAVIVPDAALRYLWPVCAQELDPIDDAFVKLMTYQPASVQGAASVQSR